MIVNKYILQHLRRRVKLTFTFSVFQSVFAFWLYYVLFWLSFRTLTEVLHVSLSKLIYFINLATFESLIRTIEPSGKNRRKRSL